MIVISAYPRKRPFVGASFGELLVLIILAGVAPDPVDWTEMTDYALRSPILRHFYFANVPPYIPNF